MLFLRECVCCHEIFFKHIRSSGRIWKRKFNFCQFISVEFNWKIVFFFFSMCRSLSYWLEKLYRIWNVLSYRKNNIKLWRKCSFIHFALPIRIFLLFSISISSNPITVACQIRLLGNGRHIISIPMCNILQCRTQNERNLLHLRFCEM